MQKISWKLTVYGVPKPKNAGQVNPKKSFLKHKLLTLHPVETGAFWVREVNLTKACQSLGGFAPYPSFETSRVRSIVRRSYQ